MSRVVHDDLDSFLTAITPTAGTDINIKVSPRMITINYEGHEVDFEFRETSHTQRLGSTLAFARAIVGGLSIGLRAAHLRGVISGDKKTAAYMTESAWTSVHDLPGHDLASAEFTIQIVGNTA